MISRKKAGVSLYSIVLSQEMEASENPSLQTVGPDPMLFCTASKKNRFYIFSSRQPDLRWVFSQHLQRQISTCIKMLTMTKIKFKIQALTDLKYSFVDLKITEELHFSNARKL